MPGDQLCGKGDEGDQRRRFPGGQGSSLRRFTAALELCIGEAEGTADHRQTMLGDKRDSSLPQKGGDSTPRRWLLPPLLESYAGFGQGEGRRAYALT